MGLGLQGLTGLGEERPTREPEVQEQASCVLQGRHGSLGARGTLVRVWAPSPEGTYLHWETPSS